MKLIKKHDSVYYSYEIEIDFEARTKNLNFGKEEQKEEEKKKSDVEAEEEFYRDEEESEEEEEEKDIIEQQQEELFPRSDQKKGEESYESCEFQVYITSENINGMLFFDCYSIESELNIRSATTIHDIEKFKSMKKEDRSLFFYQGPNFEHLDKRLQQSLKEYLWGFGIDTNLMKFLEGYSLYRDAQLYQDWLGKLKKFIER